MELAIKERSGTDVAAELEISVAAVFMAKSRVQKKVGLKFKELKERSPID